MLLHISTDGNVWCFVEWWSRTIRTGSGWATCRAFRKTPCLLFSNGKADKDGLGSFMAFQKANEIILKTSIQEYSSTRYVPGGAQLEMFVEIVKRRESFESNNLYFSSQRSNAKASISRRELFANSNCGGNSRRYARSLRVPPRATLTKSAKKKL